MQAPGVLPVVVECRDLLPELREVRCAVHEIGRQPEVRAQRQPALVLHLAQSAIWSSPPPGTKTDVIPMRLASAFVRRTRSSRAASDSGGLAPVAISPCLRRIRSGRPFASRPIWPPGGTACRRRCRRSGSPCCSSRACAHRRCEPGPAASCSSRSRSSRVSVVARRLQRLAEEVARIEADVCALVCRLLGTIEASLQLSEHRSERSTLIAHRAVGRARAVEVSVDDAGHHHPPAADRSLLSCGPRMSVSRRSCRRR